MKGHRPGKVTGNTENDEHVRLRWWLAHAAPTRSSSIASQIPLALSW
jgi:hypothetical protein